MMVEIKIAPHTFSVLGPDGQELTYAAFNQNHSLNDIARWVMENPIYAEELVRILGEMLAARKAKP